MFSYIRPSSACRPITRCGRSESYVDTVLQELSVAFARLYPRPGARRSRNSRIAYETDGPIPPTIAAAVHPGPRGGRGTHRDFGRKPTESPRLGATLAR